MSFWPDRGLGTLPNGDPYREWGELLVGAWRAGVLLAPDAGPALDRAIDSLAEPFDTPPLPSEPQPVWTLVDQRVAYLRHDDAARARYGALLRQIWSVVEPYWERQGRREAQATATELQARLRNEQDLRRLVPGNTFVHKDIFQPQIAAARERGELYLVALGLGGEGQLYWALPGFVVVGVGSGVGEKLARRRERAERAAGRFKVLSDPTRLAILAELLHADYHSATTVTELASLFGLSQPTVSVHMKMLREAGLVTAEREGNQVSYSAADATLREFVEGALEETLRKGSRPPEPIPGA
ncbi:MAG: winged helix-turn-helix domain-containing protein [Dehalococcoidia bacterium]|nr:winged helix-turn-helix domain-containing protein [Dehalococcoidia bacterium]